MACDGLNIVIFDRDMYLIKNFLLFSILFVFFDFVNSQNLTNSKIIFSSAHNDKINSSEFSSDGKFVVTASNDGTAKIWNVEKEELIFTLEGHKTKVKFAIFNPDGSRVLTFTEERVVSIWNAENGKLLFSFDDSEDKIHSVKYSPDGMLIMTTSEYGTLKVWSSIDGRNIRKIQPLLHLGFAKEKVHMYLEHLKEWNMTIKISADFNMNGTKILTIIDASWFTQNNCAMVFDVNTGEHNFTIDAHKKEITSAKYNASGSKIVTTSKDNTVKIWNANNGKLLHNLTEHKKWVWSATFSPDGDYIVSASQDMTSNIWNVNTGKLLTTLDHDEGQVHWVDYILNGTQILTRGLTNSYNSFGRIWDAKSGKLIQKTLPGYYPNIYSSIWHNSARLNSSGTQLLFRNKVWEVPTGKLLFSLSANQLVKTTSIIFDTTNGNFYTTAEGSQKFKKWDSKSGKLLKISSQKMPITITKDGISDEDSFDFGNWKDIKFSGGNSVHKSGKVLILQGLEPILCDLNNERVLQTFYNRGHHDAVTSAMFNQDQSKILTASDDATSRLWAVKTGLTLRKYGDLPKNPEDPEYGHHAKVTSANFSPTFTEMVTSGWDGSAIIWNIKNGKPLHILKEPKSARVRINTAKYSPKGNVIVTASEDSTIKIWDALTGELLNSLIDNNGSVKSIEFNPSGDKILSFNESGGKVTIWDINKGIILYTINTRCREIIFALFHPVESQIITSGSDGKLISWDCNDGKKLYTRIQFKNNDWLIFDDSFRFDGTEGAIKEMYVMCNEQKIKLSELKDYLYIPQLLAKLTSPVENNDLINNNVFKNSNLTLCDISRYKHLYSYQKTNISQIKFNFRSDSSFSKANVHKCIYEHLKKRINKNRLVLDETNSKGYSVRGSISRGDKYIYYDILENGVIIKEGIELIGYELTNIEFICKLISESIIKEIESINNK